MTDRAREEIVELLWDEFDPNVAEVDADKTANKILNLTFNGKDGKTYKLGVYCEDVELPALPEFQYDKEEYRQYLKRGAINYSKMLGGYRKIEG